MILLVDMDAFFASVEQAHHPRLRGQPVIVCGDPRRRGVVTAASYEARPSGVRAGMPLQEARRLCPQANFVEGDPERYVAISLALLKLYLSLTPDVEPFSVDEAFLALGGAEASPAEMRGAAEDLQSRIEQGFGLTASIGIGPNKLVAKMAAGVEKPRGLTALDLDGFRRVFWPLGVQSLWGVGPQLATRMRSLGITTVGELAHAPHAALQGAFGIVGPSLREAAWGCDDTPLTPYHQGVEPKSMGHEVTLPEDCADPDYLEGTLLRLSDQVARRLRAEGYVGRTVGVKLRDHHFATLLRQRALHAFTSDHRPIFDAARGLWRAHWRGGPLRLLGVTVSLLEPVTHGAQRELFEPDLRAERLRETLDRLRNKHGEGSVVPAGSLTHRRKRVVIPFGPVSGPPPASSA